LFALFWRGWLERWYTYWYNDFQQVYCILDYISFGMVQMRINDLRSLRSQSVKWVDKSMTRVDSSVPLRYHDLSDLRSLVLIYITLKECTLETQVQSVERCIYSKTTSSVLNLSLLNLHVIFSVVLCMNHTCTLPNVVTCV